jgi:xanthine dehydrogenase accessory factor
VFEAMKAQGIEQALIDRVHAPIGLEIGAETPEEIAVSIVGQMIAVMRGKA